jgi:hypothetical protein
MVSNKLRKSEERRSREKDFMKLGADTPACHGSNRSVPLTQSRRTTEKITLMENGG